MDQRKEELKRLRKGYRRRKAGCVGVLRAIAIVFLLTALAAGAVLLVPLLPKAVVIPPELADVLQFLAAQPWLLPAVATGGTALFFLFAVIAAYNHKKLKKSREFLDYRTLKTTLKAEKEEA